MGLVALYRASISMVSMIPRQILFLCDCDDGLDLQAMSPRSGHQEAPKSLDWICYLCGGLNTSTGDMNSVLEV